MILGVFFVHDSTGNRPKYVVNGSTYVFESSNRAEEIASTGLGLIPSPLWDI